MTAAPRVRLGIVGLVHAHVHWLLAREPRGDIEIVGIAEANRDLAERYTGQHGYPMTLVHDSLDAMLDAACPDAVAVFTTIRDHKQVVETCAARGVHVMLEKPLAVNLAHARAMAEAARRGGICLLTNYETTWYASTHAACERVRAGQIGPVRKVVVHSGNPGPREIGVDPEFLAWLTDPVENGAGALMDFGCYGAALIPWLMGGARPQSVTAVTQKLKPEPYPKVEDEATIVVTYPEAQGIVQASWNWPFDRKDMAVYGAAGSVHAEDASTLRVRMRGTAEEHLRLDPRPAPHDDPYAYLAAVVHGEEMPDAALSALPINLLAMEILDAALRSAESGRTVYFDEGG